MNTLSLSKVRATLSAAVLALVAITSAACANAQSTTLKVKIPFGFQNGSQHLPAGVYLIHLEDEHIVQITGEGTGGFALVDPDQSAKPATTSKIAFRRYGDRYFLRGVTVAGSTTSLHCVKSKAEKQFQVASVEPAPSDVELALVEMPR